LIEDIQIIHRGCEASAIEDGDPGLQRRKRRVTGRR
jgi:hypothetical protein